MSKRLFLSFLKVIYTETPLKPGGAGRQVSEFPLQMEPRAHLNKALVSWLPAPPPPENANQPCGVNYILHMHLRMRYNTSFKTCSLAEAITASRCHPCQKIHTTQNLHPAKNTSADAESALR